jgi:diguanylate cyclase (GGDEF)-like protein
MITWNSRFMLYISVACYILALILQFISACISAFLFKHLNEYQKAWIFLSIALFIMIYRRISPLIYIYETHTVILTDAIASLLISLFLLLGVIGLKKIILDLERKNKDLKNKSKIDILTGAFSHDEAYTRGKEDISRSSRNKKSIGFIMIDLDNFKHVNDHFGHLVGDLILKKLSMICKKEIRNVDTFSRFGGEEFLVILPGVDNQYLNEIAERLRIKIEKTNFKYLHKKINVNISAGTSLFDPSKDKSTNANTIFMKYVKRADDAMYVAKAKGKNRIESTLPFITNNL